MSARPPILCEWSGEAFVPQARFAKLCDREFVIGEVYPLVEEHGRSQRSHNHFFAAVSEAWQNLPPPYDAMLPTAEHARKYALIKAGYCDQQSHVCGSKAEAQRLRALIAPLDDFAVIDVKDAVVTVYRAKSQSTKAMGREAFQKSKDDVLGVLTEMIGVTPDELKQQARAA
jgi:hypothetical protein